MSANRIRSSFLCASVAWFAAACAAEPSQSAPDDSASEVIQTSQSGLIQGGAASRAVGIVHWKAERLGNRALFRGFSDVDELVTEFQLDNDTRLVESRFPDVGLRNLEEVGFGTMSEQSAAFVDALASDLEAAYNEAAITASMSVDEKVFQACFATWVQCDDIGWYGFLKYWWEAWDCHLYIPPCVGSQYALLTNR